MVFSSPNAGAHLLPEAEARNERRLEAVRCSAWLGAACDELLEFFYALERVGSVDHTVTVCTQNSKVLQFGGDLGADFRKRHLMMDFAKPTP
jgi:hypothetical protein